MEWARATIARMLGRGAAMAAALDWPLRSGGKLGDPRRYAATAAVAVLHVAVIWLIAVNVLVPKTGGTSREMQLTLPPLPAAQPAPADPVPEPPMLTPDPTLAPPVPPPVEIDMAQGGALAAAADILPPRPDPAIRNPSPQLPPAYASHAALPQVTLKILVAANGAVTDAKVTISSGNPSLDALAAAFAKARWHFRAATQAGEPVADWTTVIVRFLKA
ncbi:MAG TPA: TonB family protein [Rhizomicrobium sp.]|nr:TonB family protein [Rhizomicrobium sp.]